MCSRVKIHVKSVQQTGSLVKPLLYIVTELDNIHVYDFHCVVEVKYST